VCVVGMKSKLSASLASAWEMMWSSICEARALCATDRTFLIDTHSQRGTTASSGMNCTAILAVDGSQACDCSFACKNRHVMHSLKQDTELGLQLKAKHWMGSIA
jgi:hypothetical protein